LSSPSVVVAVTGVIFLFTNSPGLLEDAGNSNPDNDFRYDAMLRGAGGYIFNLQTKGLSKGTYSLSFTAGGSPTVYKVQFL